MDREDFIEILKKQYADNIHEAYLECEHEKGSIDYPSLKAQIEKIAKSASVEGLRPGEYHELVHSVLPHEVVETLYPEEFAPKAA
jgi:hypothetical protein